jgi:2-hydroxy-4-(methylsulfanyl)butanoate S-methyltransferase
VTDAHRPIEDVREISRIAYGFMASKALFAALNLDLFGRLASGPRSLDELARETAIAPGRLGKLLTACVGLGLVEKRDGDRYANAPASQAYLVPSAPAYFGDYYRFQIDRQVYPLFEHLDEALRGGRGEFYRLMADPAEAEYFSRAQHSGSSGPARVAAKLIDLEGCRRLLDVGGGTGAFSIELCRRNRELTSTILDFPNVRTVAERCVREGGLEARIAFLPGNALETPWPDGQDVVLMSYLVSAVAERSVGQLLDRALRALVPGGRLLLHDFMVEDDGSGPLGAALWLLSSVIIDPDSAALTPGWLADQVTARGFVVERVTDVIPGITRVLQARRSAKEPAGAAAGPRLG